MSSHRISEIHPVSQDNVTLGDGFWREWKENTRTLLDHQYEQLEESGALDNFRRVVEGESEFEGMRFIDSDVYKWIEAGSYILIDETDRELETEIADVISLIAEAQADDGYINTYFMLNEEEERWTNLSRLHELYCAGHLIEAAVAHHRATGEDRLLTIARSFADHIDEEFGPGSKEGTPGHPEIELALIKLYRVTDESKYLELARFFIEQRGQGVLEKEFENPDERAGTEEMWEHAHHLFRTDDGDYDGRYAQDHRPVVEQEKVEGHAVRAMYLYSAVTDLVSETGDTDLYDALERLWKNMTTKRMYITGGIGPEPDHEGFTRDYDLRNEAAYAETCASVGNIFWNHRMFQLTGESKHHDLIERVLYNGFLSGISVEGTEFFYANPLEIGPDGHSLNDKNPERFTNQRQGWFECACCPPNMARLFASIGEYIYATSEEEDVYVNQFIDSQVELEFGTDTVTIDQKTEYPWDERIEIEVAADAPAAFTLQIRLPDWCENASATINGRPHSAASEAEYLQIDREWEGGDTVSIQLEQRPKQVVSHPDVRSNIGKAALKRGPIVYCLEGTDNDWPLRYYSLESDADIESEFRPDLLGGVTVLSGEASVPKVENWDGELYQERRDVTSTSADFTAIPYYAWANREPGEMRVWTRTS